MRPGLATTGRRSAGCQGAWGSQVHAVVPRCRQQVSGADAALECRATTAPLNWRSSRALVAQLRHYSSCRDIGTEVARRRDIGSEAARQ